MLSGFTVDPLGKQSHHPVWKVSDELKDPGFDSGETLTFTPPRLFAEFSLAAAAPRWPRAYILSLSMAEQDFGDSFGAMMNDLWAKVGHEVSVKLAQLAAAGIDVATGSGLGTVLAEYMAKVTDAPHGNTWQAPRSSPPLS